MFGTAGRKIDENCNQGCEKVEKNNLLNKNGKNAKKILCRRCSSLIFPPNSIKLVDGEKHNLKKMSLHGAANNGSESIELWWKTTNEMDFDTWGCQTVDGTKALMCGDCEFGPFGFRIIGASETTFFVAAERVKYEG
ncbi:unnamed protein product [Bursaphelenchus xylophilus]|uniref:(pine wood nematode) hypothetical protein n=1 Tax=Bursaphelenchus xylophilus TaxID=6326 RepID=A0A1I7RPL1_BURXY|nr:unnamed protein product [Bursaphelenchus xylophilus]CAG9096214.1 unnamed protein product [Bursaphelenchus xylophilus]